MSTARPKNWRVCLQNAIDASRESKMDKTKSKQKKPHWARPDKYFEKEARDNVMKRPRNMGISKRTINAEVREEIKRLAKEWKIRWKQIEEDGRRIGERGRTESQMRANDDLDDYLEG